MHKNKLCSALTGLTISTALFPPLLVAGQNPFHMADLKGPLVLAEAVAATEVPQPSSAKGMEMKCGSKMKEMMDADRDGKVSKAEFMKHHEHMFEMHDKNKDGFLEDSEMGPMMDMMKGMGGGMGGMGGMKPGSGPGAMEGMKHGPDAAPKP